MFAPKLPTLPGFTPPGFTLRCASLAGLALLFMGSAQAAAPSTQEPATIPQRYAEWKLQSAINAPSQASLTELEGLLAEAKATASVTPELKASIAERADALRSAFEVNEAPVPQAVAQPQSSRAREAAEREVLRLAVEQAVRENDAGFLRTLGGRAVPALKAKALAWDGAPPPGEEQPALQWLVYVAPTEALDVALELMERRSFLLKRSTMQALEVRQAFKRDEIWVPEGDTNWRLRNPEWARILTLALEEPALGPQALRRHFEAFLTRGQLPREFGASAITSEADLANIKVFPSDGAWFLELLAGSESPGKRKVAAGWIPLHGGTASLTALAQDPTEDVQERLARELLIGSVREYSDAARKSISDRAVAVEVTEPVQEAFLLLARSPYENVRRRLARTVSLRLDNADGAPFSGAQLDRLFQAIDDYRIHLELAPTIRRLPEEERLPAVEAMIGGRARLDKNRSLEVELDPSEFGLDRAENFFTLLSFWQSHGYLDADSSESIKARGNVLQFANWLTSEHGLNPKPLVDLAERWGWMDMLYPCGGAKAKSLYSWCDRLSDDSSVRLVKTVYARAEGEEREKLKLSLNRAAGLGLVQATEKLTALAADQQAPKGARTWAVLALAHASFEELAPDRVRLMSSALAEAGDATMANVTLRLFEGSNRASLQSALVSSPDATPDFLQSLGLSDLDDETLDRFWERAPASTWKGAGRSVAVTWPITYGLAKRSIETLDPRLLEIDFSVEQARFAVMEAATITKNPALLPLIKEFLLGPHARSGRTWGDGVNAIGQYLNEDAAEALLELSKKAHHKLAREEAMAALGQITEWRAAAAAWQRSSSATAKRDRAVADLLAILDRDGQSIEARAAALKGLGLLGAVEELPRLIEALAATEPALQEAARAAIARMEKDE